ncbi:MAG TPA: SH3 domain-containing protein [Candidatus Aminicenantes bacterium]|nr:SH3 domain-containing protein [Candidatus Aminicenantes bacterium]
MRTRARLAASLILLLGAALAAPAQVAPARAAKIKVTAEQANLREKPDIGSGIVQQVPEGTVLEADRKEGEWFYVRYTLEDGGVLGGWIHESLVEAVEEAAAPAATRPAVKPEQPPAAPRERPPLKPRRPRIGPIERPEFRTGSFPLEAAFSLGLATMAPRDLNDGARGFAGAFGAGTGVPATAAAEALRAGLLAGVELNYRFSPKLAVGLAADHLKGANASVVEFSDGATVRTRPAARAVPVKVTARYSLGRGVYVRGGLGAYAVKASYLYRVDRSGAWERWQGAATASGLGGEAAFGGEWEPAARTAVFIEAGFRYARFTKLTGKDVHRSPSGATGTVIGTLTRWNEEAPDETAYPRLFVMPALPSGTGISGARAAVLDLSGGTVRAGVRYRF